MHIVVDAGNGAGGFFAREVLLPLGANTEGSVYLEPDGNFPNHIPNPEDVVAMTSIKKAVLDSRADLGLIFDTDVDRMSAVLANGEAVNKSALIAMVAAILAPDYPGSTIVTDSVTTGELTEFLEKELGLKHLRFKRGYRNVIDECKRLNAQGELSPLAIETSGHGALKENYYLDDGAYLAVKFIIAAAKAKAQGKDLASLIERLKKPAEERECRIPIRHIADVKSYGEAVLKNLSIRAEVEGIEIASPSYEGVRLLLPQGHALLRLSLHDPVMVLNVWSAEKGGFGKILRKVAELLAGFDALNLEDIENT